MNSPPRHGDMPAVASSHMRWTTPAWARSSEFLPFWQERLSDSTRKILYICGIGFDPRMLEAASVIMPLVHAGGLKCLAIDVTLEAVIGNERLLELTEKNRQAIRVLAANSIMEFSVPMFDERQHLVGPRRVSQVIDPERQFAGFTDVILDVSSFSRIVFIPLISRILSAIDSDPTLKDVAFHIVVADNAEMDTAIRGTGTDLLASPVFGYSADLESSTSEHIPKIWVPVLGETRIANLQVIYRKLCKPEKPEVCPMLPFPARNPRRADSLILAHELLFAEFGVEVGNLVYASEDNPYDVYSQILRISDNYNEALEALEGANLIISPLSSKVQSIGATMAAYELKASNLRASVVLTAPTSYEFEESAIPNLPKSVLHSLCISGCGL